MHILLQESAIGVALASCLTVVGFLRVFIFQGGDIEATLAICASLFCIVLTSVLLGTALPLALNRFGQDSASAGPCIQVLMDIIGCLLLCTICQRFLT